MEYKEINYNTLIVSNDTARSLHQQGLLEKEGHVVAVASTLDDCLRSVAAKNTDLILFDHRLAGDHLEDALKKIREQDKRVRIILLTEDGKCDWRSVLKENRLHNCCDLNDSDEKLLMSVDTTVRNLPMIVCSRSINLSAVF